VRLFHFRRITFGQQLTEKARRALFVQQLSRTSKFGANVFLLGETIPNVENGFGVVQVNGWLER
jgi:ribosomal protein S8